jgi:hypothetical protein
MICQPCATAGDLCADPGPFPEAARNLAEGMHGDCRGGTWCCCQHNVPTVAELAERHARPGRPRGLARVLGA